MRVSLVLPILGAVAALPIVVFPNETRVRPPVPVAAPDRSFCHAGNPMAGVDVPGRFTLHSVCAARSGTVSALVGKANGEVSIHLTGVEGAQHPAGDGHLVAERVPAFPVTLPAVGSRVTMVGPFVTDNFANAAQAEIYPVWHITVHADRAMAAVTGGLP